MKTLLWIAAFLGVSALFYRYAADSGAAGPNGTKCPAGADLDALLARVRSGATDKATAATMAQGYDAAGCPEAATALRGAVPGGLAEAAKPRALSPGGGGGALDFDRSDPFAVLALPVGLMIAVKMGLDRPLADWTWAQVNDDGPKLGKAILDAFAAAGTYRPGVTRLSRVTALNDWTTKVAQATAYLQLKGGGVTRMDLSGAGGGGGGSGGTDAGGDWEGSL